MSADPTAATEVAERAQMERDCRVVCWACRAHSEGVAAVGGAYYDGQNWVHDLKLEPGRAVDCGAAQVRSAWAGAHGSAAQA